MNTTTTETKAPAAARKSNWMTTLAGLIFWIIVFIQFVLVMRDVHDSEFIHFVFYNAFPAICTLAYFGMKKEQKARTEQSEVHSTVPETNI